MAQLLITANLVFFPIMSNRTFVKDAEQKYNAGTTNGDLFAGEIYTESEIRKTYPKVKECDTLMNFEKVWRSDTY